MGGEGKRIRRMEGKTNISTEVGGDREEENREMG